MSKLPNLQKLGTVGDAALFILTVPAPLVGIIPSFTVPPHFAVEILSVNVTFSTGAGLTNRRPFLAAQFSSTTLFQIASGLAIGPVRSTNLNYGHGLVVIDDTVENCSSPLHRAILPPGTIVDVDCLGLQVVDQFGMTAVTCLAWPL